METIIRRPLVRPMISAIIVSLLMTALLGYMVAGRAAILRYGAEIRLKTAPVDPRDLLKGDYVTLNYDISSIPVTKLTGPKPKEGKQANLFVRLAPGADGFWTVTEASFQSLQAQDGSVVLKSLPYVGYYANQSDFFGIPYGIERYYVPEGQGKSIESSVRSAALAVVVKVSKSGVGQIARLEMNGKPLYDEPLY